MLPCIELTRTDGSVYLQPVDDIRHIFEMPTFVIIVRITNRKSEKVTDTFDDIVTKANLDLVEFQDSANGNRRTAVNRAYVSRVAKVGDGQAIIVLKTEQSFYPVEDFDTLSPLFEQVAGGGSGGSGVTTAVNVGAGEGVFKDKTSTTLNFKSITAGPGITLTPSTNELQIASSVTGAVVTRVTMTTDGLSVVANYVGSLPSLTKVGDGDYRVTIPTATKLLSIKVTGNNAHVTGTNSFKLRIVDTDGHYYALAPIQWTLATNQQANHHAAGTIPDWANTASGERTFEWENMTFYGASGFEIVSVCI